MWTALITRLDKWLSQRSRIDTSQRCQMSEWVKEASFVSSSCQLLCPWITKTDLCVEGCLCKWKTLISLHTIPPINPDHKSLSHASFFRLVQRYSFSWHPVTIFQPQQKPPQLPSTLLTHVSCHCDICSQRTNSVCFFPWPWFWASGMIINYHGMGC